MPLSGHDPIYITISEQEGTTVVGFTSTRLTDDENIELLGRELFSLCDPKHSPRLVLDLAGVAFMTSSVLGKIITLHRKQHRREGRLVLCNIEPAIAEILETSRLISYFNTENDVNSALASFDS